MISAAQLRAARGLLDWTRSDLAKAANISPETIKNIEHGTFRPQENTAEAIIRAFAANDVEFTQDEGVRRVKNKVQTFEGSEGFKAFLDDVYEVAKLPSSALDGDKPICISYVNDKFFIKYLGDFFTTHIQRMNKVGNFKMRILIEDRPYSYLAEEREKSSYREYRKSPYDFGGNVPFYVYGDKLGILIFDEEKSPQIVVISSLLVAKAYREQFNVMWNAAKPFEKV